MGGIPSEDPYVKELQLKVETAKRDEEWRLEYMMLFMRDKENFQHGLEQGIEQGRAAEKLRFARALLQTNLLSEDKIASVVEISLEELREVKRNLRESS